MPAQKIFVRPEKSLKIRYFFNINQKQVYRIKISDVNKLKRRINNEWAALSHTVIECDNVEWRQRLRTWVHAGEDILSTHCNKDDVM